MHILGPADSEVVEALDSLWPTMIQISDTVAWKSCQECARACPKSRGIMEKRLCLGHPPWEIISHFPFLLSLSRECISPIGKTVKKIYFKGHISWFQVFPYSLYNQLSRLPELIPYSTKVGSTLISKIIVRLWLDEKKLKIPGLRKCHRHEFGNNFC